MAFIYIFLLLCVVAGGWEFVVGMVRDGGWFFKVVGSVGGAGIDIALV